ncbi:MAG: NUDIX domain-containing protein [Tissierellales bacterium]|nr:NUDIX domain-containing protein [Tissierellales bacterium]
MLIKYFVTAFLKYKNTYLLQKRNEDNSIGSGLWYGIGGHIEKEEIFTPDIAIFREINEETGLKESNIALLKLKYIALNSNDSLFINYIYFGEITKNQVISNDEGELYFIKEEDVLNKEFHPFIKDCLKNGFNNHDDDIFVAVYNGIITNFFKL